MLKSDPETASLATKIEGHYPIIRMPPNELLTLHKNDCAYCEFLRRDAEKYRDGVVDGNAIGFFQHELSLLSAEALEWLLPHYL
jgi:hypothetical protein